LSADTKAHPSDHYGPSGDADVLVRRRPTSRARTDIVVPDTDHKLPTLLITSHLIPESGLPTGMDTSICWRAVTVCTTDGTFVVS